MKNTEIISKLPESMQNNNLELFKLLGTSRLSRNIILLLREGPKRLTEIIEYIGSTPQAIVPKLHNLEKKQIINKLGYKYSLTESGKIFSDFIYIFLNFDIENMINLNQKNLYENKEEKFLREIIKLPEQFRNSIKQYLIFFNDFVRITKGKDVNLEVLSNKEGLELLIRLDSKIQIDNINKYLSEYIGFIKQNINNLQVNIETEITPTRASLLLVDLRNQIRNLRSNLEIKVVENKMLQQQVDDYYNLLEIKFQNPQPITFQSSHNTKVLIGFDIKIELPAIQYDFNKFKQEVEKYDEDLKRELEDLEKDLLEITPKSKHSRIIKAMTKLSTFMQELNDGNSKFNRIIKGTKKGIELAQKLGKSYNKFAQYLTLPQIPDLILEN